MNNEVEIWRDVVGYEGLYEVSSIGRVRSLRKGLNTGVSVLRKKPLILKLGKNGSRYLHFAGHKEGRQITLRVHKEVAKAFVPNPNYYSVVLHLDDDKSNNRASNLRWGTSAENNKSAILNGISNRAKGAKCATAKLTEDMVIYIMNSDKKCRELARELGLWHTNISSVRLGKTWNHITGIPFTGKRKVKSVNFEQ